MRWPYGSDTAQADEWTCRLCGCINLLDWSHCDECGADQDGCKAKEED